MRAESASAQGQHAGHLGAPLHSLSTDFGGSDSPVGHPHGQQQPNHHNHVHLFNSAADLGSPYAGAAPAAASAFAAPPMHARSCSQLQLQVPSSPGSPLTLPNVHPRSHHHALLHHQHQHAQQLSHYHHHHHHGHHAHHGSVGKLSDCASAPQPDHYLVERTSPMGPPGELAAAVPAPQALHPAAPTFVRTSGSPSGGGGGAAAAAPGSSLLLATASNIPPTMRRAHWSLGDYEVSRRIYKGATSAVYQATCLRSGLPVALKVYFLDKVPPNAMHMIAREITIHADVAHKHVAMLYGAFQEEGRLVLVQEYAARGDLYGIYRALRRRMTEEQVTELVMVPFLEALCYLHSRGVCHRDIKPENLLYTQDWKLLIADFGVSINLNQERAVTRAGTLDYMAPEVERCPIKYQPQDNKNVPGLAYTTAVDIWATGVLAYELLVGFPPFVTDNGGQPQPPQAGGAGADFLAQCTRKTLSFPASMSQGAREFISWALAEDPQERPTSVELLNHSWLRRALQRRLLMSRSSSKVAAGDGGSGPASAAGSPTAGGAGSVGRAPSGRAPSRLNLSVSASSPPGPSFATTSTPAVSGSGSGGGLPSAGMLPTNFMNTDATAAALAAAAVVAAATGLPPHAHSQPQLSISMSAVMGASHLQSGPAVSPMPSCALSSGVYMADVLMGNGAVLSEPPSVCGPGGYSGSGTISGGEGSGGEDTMEVDCMAGAGATVGA
ncbi:hypothetical protein HYH02_007653 [Chlamydomonas schloesseri]|uniref:Protein kinase domain-containing protein n=1 Tax=Chlamydomonas schloesseri TaxID=2026947 RepID=A0A836B4P0_9CHLO|nr:hypothetical protein HYH02_007653 [Chlamydomonas schloesseri]|eukprot:KAG2447323.1 hypothetical protein HYH02_007653 [Chlamydomonas schloesseri]